MVKIDLTKSDVYEIKRGLTFLDKFKYEYTNFKYIMLLDWRHRVPKNFSHDSIDAYIDMFRRASSMIDKAESHNPTTGRAYHPMITGTE